MAYVVGIFPDRASAENAINELKAAGFDTSGMGVAMRETGEAQNLGEATGVSSTAGAVTGAAIGGSLGALLAAAGALAIPGVGPFLAGGVLASALVGGTAGWLIGGLAGLGIPKEEAEYYQGRVEQGRVLLTVEAGNREDEARSIMRANNAEQLGGPNSEMRNAGNLATEPTIAPEPNFSETGLRVGTYTPAESMPPDTTREFSATNPRGYETQPVTNKPNDYAGLTPGANTPDNENRVVLPPEMESRVRDARFEHDTNATTNPDTGVRSDLPIGSAAPNERDAVIVNGQPLPMGDSRVVTDAGDNTPLTGQPGSASMTENNTVGKRDDDIIRESEAEREDRP